MILNRIYLVNENGISEVTCSDNFDCTGDSNINCIYMQYECDLCGLCNTISNFCENNVDQCACQDINECTNGMAQCPNNSVCQNTLGNYTCPCASGYQGKF